MTFDSGAGETVIMPCSAATCSAGDMVVSAPKIGVPALSMRAIACRMSSWLRRISISEFIISVLAETGKVSSRCAPAPIWISARAGRTKSLALVL